MHDIKPDTKTKCLWISALMHALYISAFLACSVYSVLLKAETSPSNNLTIRLATTNWCPYVCEDEQSPGFITEYLQTLLAEQGIHLQTKVLPWSRAIRMARDGAFDGLLTAVASEAPDFLFPKTLTGYYQMCFFSQPEDPFFYSGRPSLANKRLGVIGGYGYGDPVDEMIASPQSGETITPISTSNPLISLIGMLRMNRIDLFIEDAAVLSYTLPRTNRDGVLFHPRKAGCLDAIPFFTAISPNYPNHSQILSILENALKSNRGQQLYQEAFERYVNVY